MDLLFVIILNKNLIFFLDGKKKKVMFCLCKV